MHQNIILENIYKRLFFHFASQRQVKHFGTVAASNLAEPIVRLENQNENSGKIDANELMQKHWDEFTEEFMRNRIEITAFQKVFLTACSSIAGLLDPKRHDMIACLGETTGERALQNILYAMNSSDEGQRILQNKPRINTCAVNIERLRHLPEHTFGRAYIKFLDNNKVTPDSRMEVRFMDDPELAYIMARYRECHDLVHAVLGMPTNMLGEVAVKWFEALNNNLPMCYGGAIFGAMRLRPKQRKEYLAKYLPWAIRNGLNAKPLMNVFWEERWEQDIDEIRKELKITKLRSSK